MVTLSIWKAEGGTRSPIYDGELQLRSILDEGSEVYRAPDAIGNLFKTEARIDRRYGKGGQLLEDPKHNYYYDAEGNLIFKELRTISAPGKRLDKKAGKRARH